MPLPIRLTGLLCCLAGAALPAQDAGRPWSVTGYVQRSWPKQTETNRQIREQINGAFGTHFRTWDDVANVNLGVLAMRSVAPRWKVGVEVDYATGDLSGTEAVADIGFGPGTVAFKQRYSTYANVLAMLQYRPLGESGRWSPFLAAGVGAAYDKDLTTLDFTSGLDGSTTSLLRVANDGWFPVLNVGAGATLALGADRSWYLEAQVGYSWCRLKHDVPATGLVPAMAGAATVTADTDNTGLNVLLGVGRRF